MKDQKQHWNNAHREQWLRKHSQQQTEFAGEVGALIPANAAILELGCGEGNDSFFFAQRGYSVTATDFSDVVIRQNTKRYTNNNLHFTEQDISQPLAFPDESFDMVYARLSLHYFPDEQTRRIFKEIARVLKPDGKLFFMCKSVDDPIYGQGEEIEENMFERDGHVRHFFSEDYARSMILQARLVPEKIISGVEKIYDRQSGFVKASATKQPA